MTVELKKYKNLSGESSVRGYLIEDDFIIVKFSAGDYRLYLYNHSNPGASVVERMKELAERGVGLNSYINRNLRSKTRIFYQMRSNSLETILEAARSAQ